MDPVNETRLGDYAFPQAAGPREFNASPLILGSFGAEQAGERSVFEALIFKRRQYSDEFRQALLEALPVVEMDINKRVAGQAEAVRKTMGAFWEIASGLDLSAEKPAAAFLFYGPKGVGKSLLPQVLVDVLNHELSMRAGSKGLPEHERDFQLIEIDCARLPLPGAGLSSPELAMNRSFLGLLQNPRAVVVFRNFDTESSVLKNSLSMIQENGVLYGPGGVPLFFNQSVLIVELSSGKLPAVPVGFERAAEREYTDCAVKGLFQDAQREWFTQVRFEPLRREAAEKAVYGMLQDCIMRAGKANLTLNLEVEPELLSAVVDQSLSETSGLEKLRRNVETMILNPVLDYIRQACSERETSSFQLIVRPEGRVVPHPGY